MYFTIFLSFILLLVPMPAFASETLAKPVYVLSNFSGRVPYDHVRLAVDSTNGEILVLDPRDGDIRVYNSTGMEVFRTATYKDLGSPKDLTVEPDGTIYLLVSWGSRYSIYRCNYRGEPLGKLELSGFPEDYYGMRPDRIMWKRGLLYLVDQKTLLVAIFDGKGRYQRGHMMADILDLEDEERDESAILGFAVDDDGNMLFTIPTRFSAYRVSPEGEVARFGEAGSNPGKFSVASGITVDDQGNIYLTDRNRSVVMAYSPEFEFLNEFGYRGFGPGNLVVPGDLAMDQNGKLYVTQMGKKGVQVYRVTLADKSLNK